LRFAYNLNLGEIVSVDDMIDYYHIAYRYHKYICPKCKKPVIPCYSEEITSYFKHKDESPSCELYLGGLESSERSRSSIYSTYFPDASQIFKYLGFEKFNVELLNSTTDSMIPLEYLPDLNYRNFAIWLKTPFEINKIVNKAEMVKYMILISRNFDPAFFLINPNFNSKKTDNSIFNLINYLINGTKGLLFEIPNNLSLTMRKIRVWIINSNGNTKCIGKISLEILIKKTKFSYNRLIKTLNDEPAELEFENDQYEDPEHTFREEMIELRVECKQCYHMHTLNIVMNYNDEIMVYQTRRNDTFYERKHLGKFECRFCGNYFFTYKEMRELWAEEFAKKRNQNSLQEIKDSLNSFKSEKKEKEDLRNKKVRILHGQHIGKIGVIKNQYPYRVKIKILSGNEEIISISKELVLVLNN